MSVAFYFHQKKLSLQKISNEWLNINVLIIKL